MPLRPSGDPGVADEYRKTYQSLTADPNSLANLDQDLPNYLQGRVPIFSLPEEWLWCETWCGKASKPSAKTIDLCNNPLTKEPKLEQAKRIGGDRWSAIDADIEARLRESFESSESSASVDSQDGVVNEQIEVEALNHKVGHKTEL